MSHILKYVYLMFHPLIIDFSYTYLYSAFKTFVNNREFMIIFMRCLLKNSFIILLRLREVNKDLQVPVVSLLVKYLCSTTISNAFLTL